MEIEATHFGFIEAMIAVGMLLASLYFSARKELKYPLLAFKRGVLLMSITLAGIGLPLIMELSHWPNVIFLLVLMLGFGIFTICIHTPIGVWMQKDVEEEYRGRVFGILGSIAMTMMPLGYLLFGLLYDVMPAQYVVWSSSLCLLLLIAYAIRPSVLEEAYPEPTGDMPKKSLLQK